VSAEISISTKDINVGYESGIIYTLPDGVATPTPPITPSFILQEDGFYILQEDGFKIVINP
tara:strand:+ start:2254 stop:2436 length:183 start_codon:yes stop_codon:yes gene_type:complete